MDPVRLTSGARLRATGHTASDQVETVLYRLVSSATTKGIAVEREDGVVRPLLEVWREDTVQYCREHGLAFRTDSSNPDTKRGLIRDEILPLLRRLHPGADRNLLALASERPQLPRALERTLAALLASTHGTRAADLGGGIRAVREYDEMRLEGARRVRAVAARERVAPGLVVRRAGRATDSRAAQEDPGRVRGREGAAGCPRRRGRSSSRRRGRRRSGHRDGAWLGRHGPRMERFGG